MRIADSVLTRCEKVALRELEAITKDKALRVFEKLQLGTVILRDRTRFDKRTFDLYRGAHIDFTVTDENCKPVLAIEYDDPSHLNPLQQERDRIKDELCAAAGLGLLRIQANHVTRLFRGMSVLRWIVEVMELEKTFYKAQMAGHIPWDESFDTTSFLSVGGKQKYPYWLSFSANAAIQNYLDAISSPDKGLWMITATDAKGNSHALVFLWASERVIWAKTAVRRQNVTFPADDLLEHLGFCELHLALTSFQRGDVQATTGPQIQRIAEEFCERYDARPSIFRAWGGRTPFNFSYGYKSGWRF